VTGVQTWCSSDLRRFAVAAGAPPERVLVEPRSVSTFENLRFSLRLAERRGLERLALASDPYHLARARALAAYFGRPDVGLVAARGFGREPWFVRVAHLLREAMAWWYNLLKVAGWEALGALGVPEGARAELVR